MVPAWPLNNDGHRDQSPRNVSGPATERVGERPSSDQPGQRRQVPLDDRMTAIIPSATDERSAGRVDPLEAVKAALDGPPPAMPFRSALPTSIPRGATLLRRSQPSWTAGRQRPWAVAGDAVCRAIHRHPSSPAALLGLVGGCLDRG